MTMGRVKLFAACQAVILALVALALYFHPDITSSLYRPTPLRGHDSPDPLRSSILSRDNLTAYVSAILDPDDTHMPRLECPKPDLVRYEYLKPAFREPSEIRYFFALNLRACLPLLPRLIGSVVEAIRFLGPENCAISIVEGNSPDGTAEVLAALQPHLDKLTTVHLELSNDIDPLAGARFTKLAELRNLALEPMLSDPTRFSNTTVIFLNDVAICLEDILELVHQRHVLGADMTCAFDWIYGEDEPSFYDVYVARAINGDTFFEIPPDLSWRFSSNLFWNEPTSQERLEAHRPFQVFACWNGAVAFTAAPLVEGRVAFRSSRADAGECHQGEPQLFCKDMWFQGYGKIAVVPSVNLEYSNENGKRIKEDKGYVSQWISQGAGPEDKVEWQPPPDQVKCMPTFDQQTWRPWNETLT